MNINLIRPIVFFDLEATGLTIGKDHIIEISLIKLFPDEHEEAYTQRVNPGMPIPAESTAVHHITDEDVKDKPMFKDIAHRVADFIKGCDLAGFNSNKFDVPMLAEEFDNAGVDIDLRRMNLIDVQNIFHKKEPRNLIAAYKFYCNKDLEGAHAANADTMATLEVFKAQIEKYDDLPKDAKGLAEYTSMNRNVDFAGRIVKDDNGEAIFNFGKYKGKKVTDTLKRDASYYSWMMSGDFSKDTKKVLTSIMLSMKNSK